MTRAIFRHVHRIVGRKIYRPTDIIEILTDGDERQLEIQRDIHSEKDRDSLANKLRQRAMGRKIDGESRRNM